MLPSGWPTESHLRGSGFRLLKAVQHFRHYSTSCCLSASTSRPVSRNFGEVKQGSLLKGRRAWTFSSKEAGLEAMGEGPSSPKGPSPSSLDEQGPLHSSVAPPLEGFSQHGAFRLTWLQEFGVGGFFGCLSLRCLYWSSFGFLSRVRGVRVEGLGVGNF